MFWSESSVFSQICSEESEKRLISPASYNKLYSLAMMDANPEGGYFKTKCNITTKSGEFAVFRHDTGHRDGALVGDWSSWVDYCRSEDKSTKPPNTKQDGAKAPTSVGSVRNSPAIVKGLSDSGKLNASQGVNGEAVKLLA